MPLGIRWRLFTMEPSKLLVKVPTRSHLRERVISEAPGKVEVERVPFSAVLVHSVKGRIRHQMQDNVSKGQPQKLSAYKK